MEPLESDASHPDGCLSFFTGDEIDRRADAECDAPGQAFVMLVDPQFLLGCSKADDDDLRIGGFESSENPFLLLGVVFESQRRTVRANDLDSRPLPMDHVGGSIGHAWCSSQKEHT